MPMICSIVSFCNTACASQPPAQWLRYPHSVGDGTSTLQSTLFQFVEGVPSGPSEGAADGRRALRAAGGPGRTVSPPSVAREHYPARGGRAVHATGRQKAMEV